METIDNKLISNNPILIAEVFSKLVEKITHDKNEKQGYNYLKSKCLCNNSLVSEVAAASVFKLVENGALQVDEILADYITSISSTSHYTSTIRLISNLLYFKLLKKPENTIIRISILQHPFVKILQGDNHSETQMCINNEIIQSFKDLKNHGLSKSLLGIYYPVYLYTVCSPNPKLELGLLRQKLWQFLIENDQVFLKDIMYICTWLQIQNRTKSELSALLIHAELQKHRIHITPQTECFMLLGILVVYEMVLSNADCRQMIKTIIKILEIGRFNMLDCGLVLLSKAVPVCSPLYLEDLLELCLCLANGIHGFSDISYCFLKASVLPWIASPSLLTQKALKVAEEIMDENKSVFAPRFTELEHYNMNVMEKQHYHMCCNPEMFLAYQITNVMLFRMKRLEVFLEDYDHAPVHFLKNTFSFLCGLLCDDKIETKHRSRILSLIIKCSSYYVELCPRILPLILYHLSNTQDNIFLFELLKSLPQMAKFKENVPKVVATITAISNKSNDSTNFAIKLMYDTWEVENKCYSNLESFLNNAEIDTVKTNITKAYIFKKLSEKRPELYGKDLVAHLSKLLNKCSGSHGSVPTAIAIEGITHLCSAEVIDIVTTWATLAPKFKNDTRVPVVISLISLISIIPQLQYAQAFDKLKEEVVQQLWSYVTTNENQDVVDAALTGLAGFGLDEICSHMPDTFLDETFSKLNPLGGQRTVPGHTWITFLSNCKFHVAAKKFLIKLVSNEVDNYLKYVYHLKAQREPENYGGLPTHSIVRALGEFVKHNVGKVNKDWVETEQENLYISCLEILSLSYSKPLPPLDWCFLQELIHNPKLKNLCLDLASHQAILSGSARRLVESYIVAITKNSKDEDAIPIYKNLKYLANSIQPMVIKPFVENSLHSTFSKGNKEPPFEKILNYLNEVLIDDSVQHINKNVIEHVLRQLIFIADISTKISRKLLSILMFHLSIFNYLLRSYKQLKIDVCATLTAVGAKTAFSLLLNCIKNFSEKGLKDLTKFNLDKFDKAEFEKLVKIRCYLAVNANCKTPLDWLDTIFVVASKNNIRVESYYDDLTAAFKNNINHEESPAWLKEHLGQIQAKVAERCEESEIEHYCDILSVAVLYFSGFFVMLIENDYTSVKYFFPAALAFLLNEPVWCINTAQVLEWLYHMNTAEGIPTKYKHVFGWALCGLRHQDEFSKSSRWMKYLDCEIYTAGWDDDSGNSEYLDKK